MSEFVRCIPKTAPIYFAAKFLEAHQDYGFKQASTVQQHLSTPTAEI